MPKYVAEFLATFTLLLAILEGILIASGYNKANVTLITASLVSGGAITILIYGFGKISGAHMNPAVSVAMWLDHQLNTKQLFGYVIAQLLASYLAAWLIDFTHRDQFYVMGATVPIISEGWAWILEAFLTFILVLTIFRFSDPKIPKLHKYLAGAVGLVVAIEIYFAGPYSGASMNPARSFGPAIIEDMTMFHWLYFSAPITGAAVARYVDFSFRKRKNVTDLAEVSNVSDKISGNQ